MSTLGYGATAKRATGLSDCKERGKRLTVREVRNSRRRQPERPIPHPHFMLKYPHGKTHYFMDIKGYERFSKGIGEKGN